MIDRPLPLLFVLPLALVAGCLDTPAEEVAAAAGDAAASAAAAPFEATGSTSFEMIGTCLPVCAYVYTEDIGSFKLAGAGSDLVLDATWSPMSPLNEELQVYVWKGDDVVAEGAGASPLTIDVGALDAGSYDVRIFYNLPVGYNSETIDWTITGLVASS